MKNKIRFGRTTDPFSSENTLAKYLYELLNSPDIQFTIPDSPRIRNGKFSMGDFEVIIRKTKAK